MADFDRFKIRIHQATVDYGPFKFDFEDGALPDGTTISAISLKSYLGHVNPKDVLTDETDTTDELIDAVETVVSTDFIISAYFNYPTTSTYIGGVKHTLVFNLTLDNGAEHSYYAYYVWAY
jgi:hypothetical protein